MPSMPSMPTVATSTSVPSRISLVTRTRPIRVHVGHGRAVRLKRTAGHASVHVQVLLDARVVSTGKRREQAIVQGVPSGSRRVECTVEVAMRLLRASLNDLRRFVETEGRSRRLRAQLRKAIGDRQYHAGRGSNVRYTTFARQTGATPSEDVASASELSAAHRCRAGA